MESENQPVYANGKICYLELPAIDLNSSASFYKEVFGWKIRYRSDGSVTFDDTVGQVSGAWILGLKPATEIGLLVHIMVDSVTDTIESVIEHGGKLVQPIGMHLPEITARFSDPVGNILGLYQQP